MVKIGGGGGVGQNIPWPPQTNFWGAMASWPPGSTTHDVSINNIDIHLSFTQGCYYYNKTLKVGEVQCLKKFVGKVRRF